MKKSKFLFFRNKVKIYANILGVSLKPCKKYSKKNSFKAIIFKGKFFNNFIKKK